MASIPQIQIRTTDIQLSYTINKPGQTIHQPKAELQIRQQPATLTIESPPGELDIDQSRAWDALGMVNFQEALRRIFHEARRVTLEGIGNIVERGNRMAAIHQGGNPIAEIASQESIKFYEFNYYGEPGFDNVDIHYTAHKPKIDIRIGGTEIQAQAHKPELQYEPGPVRFQTTQYPKVEYIPPQIDLKV